MRKSWEIKEEIERMKAALADMQDDYTLARAREQAAAWMD